ncbi:MAG: secondary thiamine-phosphate synthase enzyme YjbQ [Reinekea sp.]|nr:secondary thiamine-phosphate synthase enzyme YjbQ [Reinekea sp.]
MVLNKIISLPAYRRGFHLVTDEILQQIPEIRTVTSGLLVLTLQHTSASLSLNENADPTVRDDLESVFNRLVPESHPDYRHTFEGPDDLPAHIKSALLGTNLSLSVQHGEPLLGTWQGIVLGEHRNHGGSRKIAVTLMGDR